MRSTSQPLEKFLLALCPVHVDGRIDLMSHTQSSRQKETRHEEVSSPALSFATFRLRLVAEKVEKFSIFLFSSSIFIPSHFSHQHFNSPLSSHVIVQYYLYYYCQYCYYQYSYVVLVVASGIPTQEKLFPIILENFLFLWFGDFFAKQDKKNVPYY